MVFGFEVRLWAASVVPVACVGAPFISAARGRRSASRSLRILLAKRKERRGDGLGLLLHASAVQFQQQPCLA